MSDGRLSGRVRIFYFGFKGRMGEAQGRKTQRFLPILRTDAGGFYWFGEFDALKFDRIEGRFAGMLPPQQPTPETRAMAQALLAAMGVTRDELLPKLGNN